MALSGIIQVIIRSIGNLKRKLNLRLYWLKSKPEPEAFKSIARKKLSYNEQREFDRLQTEITNLEKERKEIYQQLIVDGLPFEKLQEFTNRIGEIGQLIDEKELRWLEISEL